MTKQLHNIALVERFQSRVGQSLRAQLAETGILDQSTVDVQRPTGEPPDVVLEGVILDADYRHPQLVAAELRELATSAIGSVPLFRQSSEYAMAGYYEIADSAIDPPHAVEDKTVEYTLSLTRAGTRKSNLRRIAVSRGTRSHPFGAKTSADLAVPQSAGPPLLWWDKDSGDTQRASGGDVVTAQGTLTTISLSGRPGDSYQLVYDVSYADDVVGVRAYDSRGNADKFDSEGTRQWQTLYETQHAPEGNAVILSNGRVRLRITETHDGTGGTIEWAQYSGAWGSWSDITPADRKPADLDILSIDQQRVDAQILFENPDVLTDDYAVDVTLGLGMDKPLFAAAESESSSIPSGIQTALDPAARDSEVDPRAERTLVDRAEVRR